MKIKLSAPFKSLNEFETEELNPLCIITGRNGSGKTQLIELIHLVRQGQNNNLSLGIDRMKIIVTDLNHNGPSSLDPSMYNSLITQLWSDYWAKLDLMPALEKVLNKTGSASLLEIPKDDVIKLLASDAIIELKRALKKKNHFSEPDKLEDVHFIEEGTKQIYEKIASLEVARQVALRSKKPLPALTQQDFFRFPPEEHFIDNRDLFYSSIEHIFFGYLKRRHLNLLHWFANRELGKNYDCTSDNDFVNKYSPPWLIMNNILEDNEINYRFRDIPPESFFDGVPIDFALVKKSNNVRVEFSNLSSGEKVIIGLVVRLFACEYYNQNLKLPDLVVLDEPDAHLHPQLSKLLINVLHETFIHTLNVKVIMTTHSPSTVAMAPESSIYELRNEPITSLTKISKDEALKTLTFGIPTLSIDYKNHRQVFVESPTDVIYYQTLFNILSNHQLQKFKAYFISYSKGRGNCDQVIKLVEQLRDAGNEKAYGIIDWDMKFKSSNFVIVHGEDARYSIENFLFDPIYLVTLFIKHNAENVKQELNFPIGYKLYEIGSIENQNRLQEISDWIISKMVKKFPAYASNTKKLNVRFLNGKNYNLPIWYAQTQGHALEQQLKQVFPFVSGKYKDAGKLQSELTEVIATSYPFWPIESVNVLKAITDS